MNQLPNPLTPADAELRNFRDMPLDVPRLLGSDLAHDESPEACWSALLLWCASWHEVPAGSLPASDEWLAKRAGYWHKGKLDPTWNDVREGALHGWIKCSDGRLYHPVVAEKVNNAWLAKHRHAYDKLGERLRKRNKARAEKGQLPLEVPEFEDWISAGRPLERVLFPMEFSSTSGGKESTSGGSNECSAGSDTAGERKPPGIPSEKGLKGIEGNRREGKGEVNQGKSIVGGTSSRGGRDDFTPKNEGEWQRYFRERHGVELDATSVHDRKKAWPLFSAWCKRGITAAQMDAAVTKAQDEATETIAFLPAYVDRVLASLSRPAPQPRLTPDEQRRAISEANAAAWLAGEPESDPTIIDMEH